MSKNRPHNHEVEDEMVRPDKDGKPPKPATEPAKSSDDASKTKK